MSLTLLLALLSPALFLQEGEGQQDGDLRPTTATWKELGEETFDPRWILPERRTDGGLDLARKMLELGQLEWNLPHPDDEERRLLNLGDLVVAARELPAGERAAFVDRTLTGDPQLAGAWGKALRQLLGDSQLATRRWDPEEASDEDGLLFASAWELPRDEAPWSQVGVKLQAEQGAVLIHSDLTTFKEVENDYTVYTSDVGANYERIGPVSGSLRIGLDAEERPFHAFKLFFSADLPFPFSGYECDLRVLTRLRADGLVETHIYTPGGDFYWMSGRDLFVPVRTSTGDPIGLLVTRVYGFDLDGVPDGRDNRKAALRGSLGNLKRKAEARFRELEYSWRDTEGELPEFPVLGAL